MAMDGAFSALRRHFHRMRVAYVVLALSLIPAAVVYFRVRASVAARERNQFERLAEQKEKEITQRLPSYVDELLGFRGLFAAKRTVSAEDWQRYVESLEIQPSVSGIRAFGYLKRVNPGDQDAFAKLATDGHDLTIHPTNDHVVYFPVLYFNPTEASAPAQFGLDHYANAELQTVLEEAEDSGSAMVSAKLESAYGFEVEKSRPTFLVYLPIYKPGAQLSTIAERRDSLQGFVFAEFDSEKLLAVPFTSEKHPLLD